MAEFSLCIAPNNLAVKCLFIVKFLLLFCSHEFDILDEHAKVYASWHLVWIN